MSEKKFSASEAVKFGWSVMKANIGFFIGLLLILAVINYGSNLLQTLPGEKAPFLTLVMVVIAGVIRVFISMGIVRIALKFCNNEKGTFQDFFQGKEKFFDYLIASILYGLMVIVGAIALIVPGIILGIMFQFYGYLIIEKNLGPIEALKKSAAMTKGSRMDLFLFGLLLAGINLVGVLALVVGLFATVPTTFVATAFVYRLLVADESASPVIESAQA